MIIIIERRSGIGIKNRPWTEMESRIGMEKKIGTSSGTGLNRVHERDQDRNKEAMGGDQLVIGRDPAVYTKFRVEAGRLRRALPRPIDPHVGFGHVETSVLSERCRSIFILCDFVFGPDRMSIYLFVKFKNYFRPLLRRCFSLLRHLLRRVTYTAENSKHVSVIDFKRLDWLLLKVLMEVIYEKKLEEARSISKEEKEKEQKQGPEERAFLETPATIHNLLICATAVVAAGFNLPTATRHARARNVYILNRGALFISPPLSAPSGAVMTSETGGLEFSVALSEMLNLTRVKN
ncbi:hypothetical protein EVAR_92465_1 [Eumeta japonica]|uniref:Uncharacterized protein n=1 Tax=Eumeta variegata TaxID=151549 RepID=A0A4C1T8U9_EUMVA|nr:hypothetical protein EVAR_92465_1 [Eumeta japonica]